MSKQQWFLPTNTENLAIFLSSGLITCSRGFNNESYLKDVMADNPSGYIPFFSKDNLKDAIDKALVEDENLVCCIIELDLSQMLAINIYAEVDCSSGEEGNSYYLTLSKSDVEVGEQHKKIQVPAPLPIQCIKKIIFKSTLIKNEIIKSVEEFGVYPGKFFSSNASLFKAGKDTTRQIFKEPNSDSEGLSAPPENNINYDKIFSLGGMLVLMFYQTKNGRKSVSYFKDVCNLSELTAHDHKELELINNYFNDLNIEDEEYGQLYFDLLSILSQDKGSISEIKYEILSYLDLAENFIELQTFVKQTAKILRSIEERNLGKSPEEYFTKLMATYNSTKENKKIFMLLVMYFFRDKTETMLRFYHKDFQEIDYVLFSMFFGVGCRYIGLPSHVKNIKGLNFYVSNRMAEFHHKVSGNSDLLFKKVAPPKFIISDLIKEKSNSERDAFVDWFSVFFGLEPEKFQSWECKGKEFSCDSNTTLIFEEEPIISTMLNDNDITQYYFNSGDEIKSNIENEESFVNLIKHAFEKIKHWQLKSKGFSSTSNLTLKYKEKPKLISLIDIDEIEQQLVVATIGNDKDLFDYNEVFTQYEKLVK